MYEKEKINENDQCKRHFILFSIRIQIWIRNLFWIRLIKKFIVYKLKTTAFM
jgi:hypothetical protein